MSMEINAVLAQMRAMRAQAGQDIAPPATTPLEGQLNFSTVLNESLKAVSETQATAQEMSLTYASGDESVSLADTMVMMQKASLSFESVVQVRNKVLSAYQEVMSMSV
jgi:flagellar hook-basal body complex protein FliE